MRQVVAISRREFSAYFNTALGYIILVYLLLAYGLFFFYIADVFEGGVASMRGMFHYAPLVLAWTAPIVTMRLVAEEQSSGTLELLMTLPVQEWEVVLGKYIAAVGVIALGTLGTLTYPLTLSFYGELDPGPVVGGYLGLVWMACAYVALGLLCSVLTRSQVVAALVSLVLCLFFWVVDKWALAVPGVTGEAMRFLGFDAHFASIQRGVIDSRDLVFYASVVLVALALSVHILRRRRLAP